MQIVAVIVGVLIVAYVMMLIENAAYLKKLRIKLNEQFGKKPSSKTLDLESVERHWLEFTNTIPEDEKVDEVTWNDLEMDLVFHRINSCSSFVGEQVLYSTLHRMPKDKEHAESLEEVIDFFRMYHLERENTQVLLVGLGKNLGNYQLPTFMSQVERHRIKGIWLFRTMQILLFTSVFPGLLLQNPSFLLLTIGIFIINLNIYAFGKRKYDYDFHMLNKATSVVNTARKLAKPNQYVYNSRFQGLEKQLRPFIKMSNWVSYFQKRREATLSGDLFAILQDYLLGATLWDFIKYNQIITLLENKKTEYMALYHTLGRVDMAISIASFRESLPFYCQPNFGDEMTLKMDEIYHPLIDDPISNDLTLKSNCVITGSNASGKSTFIKAVAINAMLAHSIHTCMAKEMTLPLSRVITSMAVRDELMSGESYYIKEIKYLNRIVKSLSDDRLVLCVIDEILRGTNTEERIAASVSILEYLGVKNCIAVVASHDIELTQMLNEHYLNYHFREKLNDKDVAFDYKIYEGATVSRNAIKLLEYVGFPQEITDRAKILVNR